MKAQGSEHLGPLISISMLDRGFVVSCMFQHFTHSKSPWYPLSRRQGGAQRSLLPLTGIEACFLGCPGCSLGTILTRLAWPLIIHLCVHLYSSSSYVVLCTYVLYILFQTPVEVYLSSFATCVTELHTSCYKLQYFIITVF